MPPILPPEAGGVNWRLFLLRWQSAAEKFKLYHCQFFRCIGMKFGCLINLVLYTAMAWGYYAWWSPTVDPPHVWIIALVAAGFSYLGLTILYNAWLSTCDSRALAEAHSGSPLPHGRWSAAAGTLAACGKTLTSPCTGRECVMLEYGDQP